MIRAGDPVLLMLGAANRDPAVFSRPDELVFGRMGPEPLVFGAGAYRCIGAQLASFEAELAIRKILQRPDLHLAGEPTWSARTNVVPLTRLPAVFK